MTLTTVNRDRSWIAFAAICGAEYRMRLAAIQYRRRLLRVIPPADAAGAEVAADLADDKEQLATEASDYREALDALTPADRALVVAEFGEPLIGGTVKS